MSKHPKASKPKPPRKPDVELLGDGHLAEQQKRNYENRDYPAWLRRQAESKSK